MSRLVLGVSSSGQGPAAALLGADGTLAAAEESRLTRARGNPGTGAPLLAVAELLGFLGRPAADIEAVATTSSATFPFAGAMAVPDHEAHATYAFRASPFDEALVVVCDGSRPSGWSAWRGAHGTVSAIDTSQAGAFPLADLYCRLTRVLGFAPQRDEHIIEAMARAGDPSAVAPPLTLRIAPEGLVPTDAWRAPLETARQAAAHPRTLPNLAAAAQAEITTVLLAMLSRAHGLHGSPRACLAGGLFYNTHFATAAAMRGPFEQVFIPAHPGNGGSAVGAALVSHATGAAQITAERIASPFLGPSYSPDQVKAALDNCKLSYDLLPENRARDLAVQRLSKGELVAWFGGRMEWGPRALGHRSVLANPFARHVLDNLNGFLKQREWYRSYGVSVPQRELAKYFEGPGDSAYMQFEYRPRDRELFKHILPQGAETLRVHTVDDRDPTFLRLLETWGEQSGAPILVNTSFNGFHEPLVCSPRDAVRVFYGTGLDMVVIEGFVLRK